MSWCRVCPGGQTLLREDTNIQTDPTLETALRFMKTALEALPYRKLMVDEPEEELNAMTRGSKGTWKGQAWGHNWKGGK